MIGWVLSVFISPVNWKEKRNEEEGRKFINTKKNEADEENKKI